MWPVIYRVLMRYAPIVTLPFAAIIGYVGYTIENKVSDKFTPFKEPIKESRNDRLLSDETLKHATEVESLKYSANVLGKNLSPSLQPNK